MKVDEISSVDRPAQKGAVAVIVKNDKRRPSREEAEIEKRAREIGREIRREIDACKETAMDIRKDAASVAKGDGEASFTAVEYGDEIMKRAEEIGREEGISSGQALLRYASTDPVLCELAVAERTAATSRLAKRSRDLGQHLEGAA
ncbi:hypothetical protein NCF86_01590 [Pelagerythrobacter marinus]|nr:hypothetical protein NCF86_01590 [Pelagerythrobacter marinus]